MPATEPAQAERTSTEPSKRPYSLVGPGPTVGANPPVVLGVVELPPSAIRAEERELRRLVAGEESLPPLAIRRQPHLAALGAIDREHDTFRIGGNARW